MSKGGIRYKVRKIACYREGWEAPMCRGQLYLDTPLAGYLRTLAAQLLGIGGVCQRSQGLIRQFVLDLAQAGLCVLWESCRSS